MSNLSIIGVGSPFGADNIGCQIVESLKSDQAFQNSSGVTITFLSLDRPGLTLLNYFEAVDSVILIDAVESGITGKVREIELCDLLGNQTEISSHGIGVVETLSYGESLGLLPQDLMIIGIEVGEGILDGELIKSCRQKISKLVTDKLQCVDERLNG